MRQQAWITAKRMAEKKGKYLTKQVKFGGAEFTLYSIDGVTWSSNKNELEEIHERHERQRQVLIDDTREYLKREKERQTGNDEGPDEGYSRPKRQSSNEEDIDELDLHEVNEGDESEEASVKRRRGRPPKALQSIKEKYKGSKAAAPKEAVKPKAPPPKLVEKKPQPKKEVKPQKAKPQPKQKKAPAKAPAKKPVKKAAKPKPAPKGKAGKRRK